MFILILETTCYCKLLHDFFSWIKINNYN